MSAENTLKKSAPFAFWNGAPNGALFAPFLAEALKGNGNGAKVRHSPPPMARRSLAMPFLTAFRELRRGGLFNG